MTRLLTAALVCLATPAVGAPIIWDGPAVSFTKGSFVDTSLPENQDRITDDIWITRNNTMGLYNAAVEASQGPSSPTGTEWAVGTTADLGTLSFDTWLNTVGLSSPLGGPPNSVGVDFVVHLLDEDIYLDLRIDAWGVGSGAGGSFAYTRSTGVPEPSAALLGGLGLLGVLRRRTR